MKSSLIISIVFLLALSSLGASQSPAPTSPSQTRKSIAGNWDGVLDIGQAKLRLVLKIKEGESGALYATVDSLDQNATDLKIDKIELKTNALHFEMNALNAAYDGVLSADGNEIAGNWEQGKTKLPLTFRRSGQKVTAAGTTRGKIEFKPCGDIKAGEDAQCGKFEVFEDRATKIGRKITLNIILLPALSAKPAADATFYLAGGPGGAATNAASASFMPGLRKERDVVLVDQRGTGKSNPLQQFSRRAQRHARIFFRSLPGRKSPSL